MRRSWNRLGFSALFSITISAIGCSSSTGSSTTSSASASSTGGTGEPSTGASSGGTSGAGTTAAATTGGGATTAAATSSSGGGSTTGEATSDSTGGTTGAVTSTGGGTTTTGGGTTGGIAHGPGNDGYCDGLAFESQGTEDFLIVYPEADAVYADCDPASLAPDAGTFTQLGGIWAFYQTSSAQGVFPGGCDDMGFGSAPGDAGPIAPPDGGTTVAAALGLEIGAYDAGLSPPDVSVYGVVTFSQGYWTDGSGNHAGTFYIEDMPAPQAVPAPYSGMRIYIPSSAVGTAGLPTTPPARGDVVLLTDLSEDFYGNNLEFDYQPSSSTLTILGQSALPPAVTVSAADLESQSTTLSSFYGMRVVDPQPFTVVDTCPTIQ